MRIANFVLALLLTLAVLVQYNDPDPFRWMAMYGAGFVACLLWDIRRLPRALAAAIAATALAWGIWIVAGMHLTAPFGEALTDWEMHAGGSEELRESLGLFLLTGWMAVLAARPKRA